MSSSSSSAPQRRVPPRPVRASRSGRGKFVVIAVVLVVVVAAVLVAVLARGSSSGSSSASSVPTGQAATEIAAAVTSVTPTVIDQVGIGAVKALPAALSGPALTEAGKPSLLYIGAEFCPFCAGERWAIVNALGRFGSFTGLAFTHSSVTDVHPDTATFTFRDVHYKSDYVTFDPVEVETNQPDGKGGYTTLQTPTAAQEQVWSAVDPQQSFPFLDIGGSFVVSGASYDVGVLQGKTASQISALLGSADSDVAQSVIGTANVLTAAICTLTAQKPSNVCQAAGVAAAASKLAAG
jgi:hypothetical protein